MSNPLAPAMLFFLVCAFVAGWVVAKLVAYFGPRWFSDKRDPKDTRISSLEAELRVAKSNLARSENALNQKDEELEKSLATVDEYATTMNEQAAEIERLGQDLQGSVRKTNELREELTSRVEENLRATVKLQEVETELSVVRDGSDLLSTAKLSYDSVNEDDAVAESQTTDKPQVVKFTI